MCPVRRRHLTILVSDVSQFSTITQTVDPEYTVEVVNHLKRCAKRVIPNHSGTIVGFRGDCVMAMFGFPEPSEHDGRRAVAAALELHAAIRDLGRSDAAAILPPLTLHTGIDCGLVAVPDDVESSGDYDGLGGEPPVVATRLCETAEADEILVSAATLGGESHFFEIRDRRAMKLHGLANEVAVIQVLGQSSANTRYEARTQRGLTPFAGRVREIGVLGGALREVVDRGFGRTVAVVAPAGVGKTRLIEQFLHEIDPLLVDVFRAYCEDDLGAEPLQPFRQIVRQLAAVPSIELDPTLSGVSTLSASLRSADDAARTFCDLFGSLARRRPLVLFLDDWQWADDASKQVLATVRQSEVGMLVVIAMREPLPVVSVQDVQVLHLSPLQDEEAAETIRRLHPDADPFSVRQIQELSGGNPLYIEELCHWTSIDRPAAKLERGGARPAWLSTLIESRVGRLPSAQAELVRAAAVIGAVMPTWLLEQVTGHSEHDPVLQGLAANDLIFPGEVAGTVRFKHGVTRDVVYASVTVRERERLHRHIAKLLERRGADASQEALLEPMSYHFRAGADFERAAHYAELAGNKALAAAAPDRARSQYASALSAIDELAPSENNYLRWSQIVHRFGLACVFDPTRDQLRLFHRAADLARARGDEAGIARAEYWIGFIHYALGDALDAILHYELARHYCTRALDNARIARDRARVLEMEALAVQLRATVGQARAAAGQPDAALALLDEAIAVKRRHRRTANPAVGSAYALACKGAVLGDVGRFVDAYECFEEALEAIRAGHTAVEASIRGWQSAVYLWHGRWPEARESAIRAQTLAQRFGGLYVLAMGQAVAAYANWMAERSMASFGTIVRATSWLETRDERLWISMNYGWLADIAAAEGNSAETRKYAAKAVRRARIRDLVGEPMAYRALASLRPRDRGRAPEEYLARAMRSAVRRGSPREQAVTLLHQARETGRAGHRTESLALIERARAAFASMDMSWHDAIAQRYQAELRDGESRH